MTSEDTATAPPEFTMRSPIFGHCRLIPHGMDEPAQGLLGYVAFEGDPNNLTVAILSKGEWRQHNLKPFPRPIANWYSVEKIDGTPIF